MSVSTNRVLKALLIVVVVTLAGLLFAQQRTATPSLNDFWKGKDTQPLVDRLEEENREIYRERVTLAAVTGPLAGSSIADLGAGSGFMVEEFSKLVGPGGKVYAVDINPDMLQRIADSSKAAGMQNVETIICPEDSANLPDNSVDMVFICDTYHHFEYPAETMASVHRALRPGGQLVVVDFNRVEGVSEEWMLQHVRAGKDVFLREIEEAGFELINEHSLPMLAENYILRFRVRK